VQRTRANDELSDAHIRLQVSSHDEAATNNNDDNNNGNNILEVVAAAAAGSVASVNVV